MAKVKIEISKCKGCYLCISNCPNGLLKVSGEMNIKGVKPVCYSGSKCTGCSMCAVICPDGVIKIYKEGSWLIKY